MVKIYKTNIITGKLEITNRLEKGCLIDLIAPTDNEINDICIELSIPEQLIRYPLDISEKAHIDSEYDNTLIVIDVPYTETTDNKRIYTTIPFGMIVVRNEYFITVSQKNVNIMDEVLSNLKRNIIETEKRTKLIFQVLYKVAEEYIKHIGYISRDIEMFEKNMHKTMKNRELIHMLDFEKSMIYYNASLKANQVVLQKLLRGKIVRIYEEDEEILDDTMIENKQAIEMVQTYSEILNGIVSIFGTIVSNNVNSVMKFLTAVTIIISIPTMIAGIFGMNLNFPFEPSSANFYIIIAASIILSFLAWVAMKNKNMM